MENSEDSSHNQIFQTLGMCSIYKKFIQDRMLKLLAVIRQEALTILEYSCKHSATQVHMVGADVLTKLPGSGRYFQFPYRDTIWDIKTNLVSYYI